jgi:hypothetical protein
VRARQLARLGGALPQHGWFRLITNAVCDLDHISLARRPDMIGLPGLASYFT